MIHGANLIEAAHQYLGLGLRVIALSGKAPNGKVHQHGLKDAFANVTETVTLASAFHHPQTTGIGILTGMPYYVVDIDGPEGASAWKELVGTEDYIPDRWVVMTHHGLHLYVASWEQFPTTKLAKRLDFKGDGGYVAAPPSVFGPCSDDPCLRHHQPAERYVWLEPPALDPMEMPEPLHKFLARRAVEAAAHAVTKIRLQRTAKQALTDGKWYPVATFDGIIQTVKDEPEGNRNAVLYWAARTMLEQGADDDDLEELLDAAYGSGLTNRESKRTIRSAIEALGG